MKNALKTLFCLVPAVILLSCNADKVFEKHHKFKDNTWHKSEIVTFEADMKGSGAHDIIIAVRHAGYYPFANVIIGLTIETPEGETRFMQHNLVIRNTDGSFMGSGLGDIWDIEIPVFTNFPFQQRGTYRFIIENRMHLTEMKGLMEIGLIIKKSV